MSFICERCNKELKTKYSLKKHLNKKNPCKDVNGDEKKIPHKNVDEKNKMEEEAVKLIVETAKKLLKEKMNNGRKKKMPERKNNELKNRNINININLNESEDDREKIRFTKEENDAAQKIFCQDKTYKKYYDKLTNEKQDLEDGSHVYVFLKYVLGMVYERYDKSDEISDDFAFVVIRKFFIHMPKPDCKLSTMDDVDNFIVEMFIFGYVDICSFQRILDEDKRMKIANLFRLVNDMSIFKMRSNEMFDMRKKIKEMNKKFKKHQIVDIGGNKYYEVLMLIEQMIDVKKELLKSYS